jgi:integrase
MTRKRRRAPGHGSVYLRGSVWWVRWRQDGQRRTARFPNRAIAEKFLAKLIADLRCGEVGLPVDPRGVPTLGELAKDWLDRRKATHRSNRDERSRWTHHLGPFFGRCRPAEVTPALIRKFIEEKLPSLSSTSVGHCVRQLSSFFTDLVERGMVPKNPVAGLPRGTKRLIRNAHDPRTTPFLERREDIRRVYLALPVPTNVAFAVGALAGLRNGELLGLSWEHVSLETRRIHVRQQVHRGRLGPLKDDESRVVPILDSLLPILREWRARTGGEGLLFRPRYPLRGGRPDLRRPATFMRQHTLGRHLLAALKACDLWRPDEQDPNRRLNWYRCTRHTFASHWVLDGRSIEKLAAIMGHEDISTTMRYAHLRGDLWRDEDLAAVRVDLSPARGKVIPLASRSDPATLPAGHNGATEVVEDETASG